MRHGWADRPTIRRDVHGLAPYDAEGGRVIASERLRVLAVDGDVAAVLRVDELDVQTVELRRIVRR